VPAYAARSVASDVVMLVLVFLLGLIIFMVGLVLAMVTWAAAVVGILGSALGHVILRRPFLVELRSDDGQWRGWWVTGWR